MIIDHGYRYLGHFHGNNPVIFEGIDVLRHPSTVTDDTVLMTLPDNPGILVAFGVSEFRVGDRLVRIGIAELTPNIFGVVVPA